MKRTLIIGLITIISLLLPPSDSWGWTVAPGETLILSKSDAPWPEFSGSSPVFGDCHNQVQAGPGEFGIGCFLISGVGDSGWKKGTWTYNVSIPGTVERMINAKLSVEINIGGWIITEGAGGVSGDFSAKMLVYDSSNNLIASREIVSVGCQSYAIVDPCSKNPTGSYSGNLELTLTRGHQYRIIVSARTSVDAPLAGEAMSNFFKDDIGNGWVEFSSLTLTLDEDIAGMIEELDAKIDTLDDKVDDIDVIGIQKHLVRCTPIVDLFLPSQFGGRLEEVFTVVEESIARAADAGIHTWRANYKYSKAQAQFAKGDYEEAYRYLCKAYEKLGEGVDDD